VAKKRTPVSAEIFVLDCRHDNEYVTMRGSQVKIAETREKGRLLGL